MGDEEAAGKPRFEPPPWEKEAFDALAARRAEEQLARAALAAASSDPWDEMPNEPAKPVEPAGVAAQGGTPAAKSAEVRAQDPAIEAMMLQLRNEERTDATVAKRVGRIAAVITMALGLGMLIAGISLIRGANGTSIAVIGSLVLSVFGVAFMGMALWVWITTSRSRGR
jgi:hypothetical protein